VLYLYPLLLDVSPSFSFCPPLVFSAPEGRIFFRKGRKYFEVSFKWDDVV
jgi:hypothetical protein